MRIRNEVLVETLKAQVEFVGLMNDKEKAFAKSLIDYYKYHGKLTDEQNKRGFNLFRRCLNRPHDFPSY